MRTSPKPPRVPWLRSWKVGRNKRKAGQVMIFLFVCLVFIFGLIIYLLTYFFVCFVLFGIMFKVLAMEGSFVRLVDPDGDQPLEFLTFMYVRLQNRYSMFCL